MMCNVAALTSLAHSDQLDSLQPISIKLIYWRHTCLPDHKIWEQTTLHQDNHQPKNCLIHTLEHSCHCHSVSATRTVAALLQVLYKQADLWCACEAVVACS
jgi:hypothetical protein